LLLGWGEVFVYGGVVEAVQGCMRVPSLWKKRETLPVLARVVAAILLVLEVLG
jgi:hypothetical protein